MNKDSPVGRIMTLGEAMEFWTRCKKAEEVMGPLSREERIAILGQIGKEVTLEELADLVRGKRTLVIKQKEPKNESST